MTKIAHLFFYSTLTLSEYFDILALMKIMIDLDRVVFDCPSVLSRLGNFLFTKSTLYKTLKYNIVDAERAKSSFNTLFFLKITHWQYLQPIEDAINILKLWNKQGFTLHFVSSRPNLNPLKKSAVEWLEYYNINYSSLIFACTNKPLYCLFNKFDVIIDDTLKNCTNANRLGINSIWLQNKFNEKYACLKPNGVFTTKTWFNINKIVQKINLSKQKPSSEKEIEK